MAARPLRIGILVIVAFAAGLILARVLTPARVELPQTERATVFPTARALPTLDLTSQDGQALPADFLSGHWTLVFFGFTQCPDICPTTLAVLAQAGRQLDDLPQAEQPRVLLVSVDPERDTPEALAALAQKRKLDTTRWTLAQPATADLRKLAAVLDVQYRELDDGEFNHSSIITLLDPQGRVLARSSNLGGEPDPELVAMLRKALAAAQQ